MSTHAHDIQSEIKGYIIVGVSLLTLTVVTVSISYLHLKLPEAIAVALFVATVKGSLVACYFMHLISEKKLIYLVLSFTVFFFTGMIGLILFGHHDPLVGTKMLEVGSQAATTGHH